MTLVLLGGERPKRSESLPEKDARRLVGEEGVGGGEFSLLDMAKCWAVRSTMISEMEAALDRRVDVAEAGVMFDSKVVRGAYAVEMNNRDSVPDRSMSLFLACIAYAACVVHVVEAPHVHVKESWDDDCKVVGDVLSVWRMMR